MNYPFLETRVSMRDDEGSADVVIPKGCNGLVALDILQDYIGDLQRIYDYMLAESFITKNIFDRDIVLKVVRKAGGNLEVEMGS